jgi:ParB family chromosome partitioning protein
VSWQSPIIRMADEERGALEVTYVAIRDLTPYEKNSRLHSEAQVAQIAASIQEFSFTNPILVDEGGGIIAGHGRLAAAKKLGMTEVPCIVLSGLTRVQKQALVIADNRLALNARWDEDILAGELGDIASEGFDLSVIGFSPKQLDEFLASDVLDPTIPDLGPKHTLDAHTCPACGHRWVDGD